jgi:hypothetical protein
MGSKWINLKEDDYEEEDLSTDEPEIGAEPEMGAETRNGIRVMKEKMD